MLEVSDAVKAAYRSNSITKHVQVGFPDLGVTVGMEDIHYESLKLSEAISDSDSIEFVGCISSKLEIKVQGLTEDVKGEKMTVTIWTDGTEDEPVTLFNGIVDSAVKQSNRQIKELTAYDALYTKGSTDVSDWYNALSFPITLKDLRDSLFDYLGIEQEETDLPNDDAEIEQQYSPSSLKALSVIKAMCQINGAFGIINREGLFEYRILTGDISTVPYPTTVLYPETVLYPNDESNVQYPTENLYPDTALYPDNDETDENEAESFSFYKSVSYEEFEVKPVDKVTIREDDDDEGVSYEPSGSDGENRYIIQGNMFAYGLDDGTLYEIARNIYSNVQGFYYVPFESDNNGLPWIECGDAVEYTMIDYENSTSDSVAYMQLAFYVLSRTMSGIQALRDAYSAEGEEYQTEFITDLQTQIDILKKATSSSSSSSSSGDTSGDTSGDSSSDSSLKVLSVEELPDEIDENTIYLIQGEVTVE